MSVKKNFIYSTLYQMLLIIAPLLTVPYTARVLGSEGTGIYAYTFSIASYCVLLIMLGVNNYGNRSIATIRDNPVQLRKVFWGIYSIQVFMFIVVAVGYAIYYFFFVGKYKLIFSLQFLYLFSAVFDINWFFFGIEKFKLTVTRNAIFKVLTIVAIFLFVKQAEDVWIYTLILALGTFVNQLVLWPYIFKYVNCIKLRFKDIKVHFIPNLYLFIPVIAVSLYKVLNKIMLGNMSSMTQLGFYENTEKVLGIPMGLITALGMVMLPRMTHLYAQNKCEQAKKYLEVSVQFAMMMSFGIAFGIAGIAPKFVPFFFGNQYLECIQLIIFYAPAIIFVCWANVIRTQYLIPRKRDKDYIISVFMGAIINVLVNLVLIKEMGALGTVIGAVLTEVCVATYQTVIIRKELEIKKYLIDSLPFLLFGVLMYILLKQVGSMLSIGLFSLVVQILIGASLYLFLSFLYLIRTKSSLVNINILKKLRGIKK